MANTAKTTPYYKKRNTEYYLKNGLLTKIKKAIKAHNGKNYIIIKKVISRNDALRCIINKSSTNNQLEKNRFFDR